ncbi:3-keto-5-aminohexanoate cleavage protein [Streptomyces sp. NPDC093795]|uniref:3-keto-5-aminohexanoate cleavage protein n=1 Tax=Streptomyces sp. NPDC093795 TaxID=3366051 RepID=UPI00380D3459
MLQACLNGLRGPGDSAAVPVSPESLAESAARAVAAGAREVRVYARTPCGASSLSPRVLTPLLDAVRAAVGTRTAAADGVAGARVRVATAVAAETDPGCRVERIHSWPVLPDLVSVDWHEPDAEEVAAALLQRGVGVEAALRSGTDGPARFARSPLAPRVRRIAAAVPYPETKTEAEIEAAARSLLAALVLPPGVPVLLHGEEGGAWPVLRLARRLGLAARIGFEDTLLLPDGTPARSNAELVTTALGS